MLDVINDILDVAKIEAGRLRLKEELVDVRQSAEVCISMLSLMADEAKVVVKMSVADNLPHLYADEVQLKQIISNLLSNAIKFTNPDGIVTVTAGLDEAKGLSISIADTGIGIAEEDIENALSQFGQVTDKYARNKSGTGLGLPLVQLITAEHDGSFEFSSKLGVGTTAVIHFPSERLGPQSNPCRPQSPATSNWARKAI
ncbi:MAG: HAMP domain-containing histidine kinase [Sneathiella sp.]|nr:HAMP domain-containing histidine kinase [Sneathiella sp.]